MTALEKPLDQIIDMAEQPADRGPESEQNPERAARAVAHQKKRSRITIVSPGRIGVLIGTATVVISPFITRVSSA